MRSESFVLIRFKSLQILEIEWWIFLIRNYRLCRWINISKHCHQRKGLNPSNLTVSLAAPHCIAPQPSTLIIELYPYKQLLKLPVLIFVQTRCILKFCKSIHLEKWKFLDVFHLIVRQSSVYCTWPMRLTYLTLTVNSMCTSTLFYTLWLVFSLKSILVLVAPVYPIW